MTDAAHDSKPPGAFYCPTCEKNFTDGDVCPNDGTRLVRLRVTDPLIGRVLDGRYTIHEKLGQGGMGSVYRGSQHSVGREVAIKLVTPTLVSDPDVIKRFLREAKLASRLSHPNAVAVMDFGQTDDGLFYLVMELVTGRTLDQVIKTEKKLKPERVIRIGMQVCDALEGAHALQIVHRDLKPANIMLMAQGRDLVKVLDFGLAKSLAPDQTSTTMTNAGSLLGTPAFMPPELALGQPCDGRADLYSLGCVLYLLGSGRLPFVSESAHELIAMHGTQLAPPMEGVPPQLADVVDRLLRKNPAERFQNATDTREALEVALDASRMNTPVSGVARVGMSTPSGPLPAAPTPVPGTPVPGRESSPSVPSSAKPMQTLLATPSPSSSQSRPRASTEMERLGNSDTILPSSTPAMTSAASIDAPPAKKSRAMVVVGLAALVVIGVAVTMFAMKKSPSSSTQPPATQPEVAKQPEITQPEQPTQPPEQQTVAKQPEQPAAGSATTQPDQPKVGAAGSDATKVVPEVTKVVPEVTKVVPEVTVKTDKRHHATTKTTKTTDTTKTTKTDATKMAPAGTGSAGPAKLPF